MNYSIIIPIYNTQEKFLNYNLQSLLEIKRQDLEILLIDDGSEKYINEICNKYIDMDKRFKYYRTENAGVSNARNVGIEKSSGRNLIFLDADDFLDIKTIDTLPGCNSFDIIVFDYFLNYELKGNKIFNVEINYGEYYNKDLKLIKEKMVTSFYFNTIHSKIYKKNILIDNKIRFPINIKIGEDVIFNLNYFSYCRSFKYEKKILTNYRVYDSSSVRQFPIERFSDFENEYDNRLNFIKKENIEKECIKGVYNYTQRLLFSNVLNSIISGVKLDDIYKILSQKKYREILGYRKTNLINRFKMFLLSNTKNKVVLLQVCKLKQMKGKI